MNDTSTSLATGAELTAETFADFAQRLRYHCKGEGVSWHYTASAIFLVEARRFIYGIDSAYTDKTAILCDDSAWHSPQEYWDDADEETRSKLDEEASKWHEIPFLECCEENQLEILGDLEDHAVTGWDERWEYVNAHFTKEAAEAFIKRKAHDYRAGLRVYVDAQTYCLEFEAIKEGILSGQIAFVDASAQRAGGAA